MFQPPRSPGRNHRNAHRRADRTREVDVVPIACAVLIHACQQYLAGSEPFSTNGPFNRIQTGVLASAVSVDLPALAGISRFSSPRVDGDDDTLAAKSFRSGA